MIRCLTPEKNYSESIFLNDDNFVILSNCYGNGHYVIYGPLVFLLGMSRGTGMCPHDIAHSLEMLNMVAQKDDK